MLARLVVVLYGVHLFNIQFRVPMRIKLPVSLPLGFIVYNVVKFYVSSVKYLVFDVLLFGVVDSVFGF